jgi:molecular chaperone DnaK (HSP70)
MLTDFFDGRSLCKSINPDEAVAYGAAVQGAILGGIKSEVTDSLLLVDVTPLSLGVETEGKHMSVIVPRNTSIPCKKAETYTTTDDYQTSIEIKIFEGERLSTEQNHLLGEFTINGIERAKRGVPQVEVTFALDSNGILSVTAKDKSTGATANTTISDACKGLSAEEIDAMLADAEKYKAQDEEVRKKVEMAREMDELAYIIDDKGTVDQRRDAEELMAWLTENMANLSISDLSKKQIELKKIVSKCR